MATKRKCYGCHHLDSERLGDGTSIFKCRLSPGLVVGEVGAFDNDEPHEVDGCYEAR